MILATRYAALWQRRLKEFRLMTTKKNNGQNDSAERNTQQSLKESDLRVKDIIDNAPFGAHIYELNPKRQLIFIGANHAADLILKVSNKQFIGKTIEEAFPPLSQTEIPDAYRRVAATGERYDTELMDYYDGSIRGAFEVHAFKISPNRMAVFFHDITERKQAEEKIKRAHRDWENIFQAIGHATLILDKEHRIISANRAAAKATGMTAEDLAGKKCYEVFHRTDTPQAGCPFEKLSITGQIENEEMNMESLGREYLVSCTPVFDEAGRLGKVIHIATDITVRRLAEQERQRLTDILESTNDFVAMATLDGKIKYINRHGLELIGLNPGIDLSSLSISDTHSRWAYEYVRDQGLPAAAKNGIWAGETALLHADGREIPVSQVIMAHKTPDGKLQYFSTIMRDVTVSKAAEKALLESEAKLKSIFTAAPVGIGLVCNRVLLELNDTLCLMTGYSRHELLGQNARILYPSDEDYEYVGQEKYRQISQKGTGSVETRWRRKDGEIIHIILSSTPLDQGDLSKGVTFTALDITERNRADEARAKLEEQYRQAQKIEAIGQLAGGVAHDFNNMLNIILGYSQMAMMKIDPSSPLHADIREIVSAGKRSTDLVRQLLAFARKQTIAPKVLDLNYIVAGMLNMLRKLIGEDIDLLWMPAAELWPVKMDPAQVDQILANLAVNARDAISGVGKMTIETGNAEFDEAHCEHNAGIIPGQYVLLAVSDNGCGMDNETLEKIYEPFFTTKELGKGTGMGLSTVYGIVKQNNGFIDVYSEPGKGTTFKIYLPGVKEEEATIDESHSHARPLTGTERVLLVEDDKALLKMAEIMLEGLGYEVLAAGTPNEAIGLAEQYAEEIHLLITDVVMPEMSGRDLQKRISALRPGIKCLFMSGYTANVIAHRGILDEGVNFLQKPFHMEDLAARVRKALEKE